MTRIDYSLFEDKYYQMDPLREDLLFDGTELQEGMIVLIESPTFRVEIIDALMGEDLEKAMRYNRWAMVTRVVHKDGQTTFLAVYADDSKKKIQVPTSYSWLVLTTRDYEPPSFDAVKEYVERDSKMTTEVLGKVTDVRMDDFGLQVSGVINREKILLDEDIDPSTTAIGTAKVEDLRAWSTRSTPPFGGGDGDLMEPMPKREPGAIFDEIYQAKLRDDAGNETQI